MSTTAFNSEEFDLAYPEGVENHYWTITRLHILYKTLFKYKDTKNIIEVGCGKGIVVDGLRKHGLNVQGCELANVPSLESVKEFIHTNTDANKMPAKFRESFDTMMLLDVIEHIENEKDFLKGLLSNYPNVKRVLITVPARQEIWSNYDEFYGHFRRYSTGQLKNVLNDCGLTTKYIRYFFHTLYPSGLLLKKMNVKREIKVASPKGFGITLHKMLSSCFKIEMNVMPGGVFGTSIIAVAERKLNA